MRFKQKQTHSSRWSEEYRAQNKARRFSRRDRWTRAMLLGLRKPPLTAEEKASLLEAGQLEEVLAKRVEKNRRRRLRQGRGPVPVAASQIAAVTANQRSGAHFCAAYNRKRAEGKRRIHARGCDTCKDMLKDVIRQKLLAKAVGLRV